MRLALPLLLAAAATAADPVRLTTDGALKTDPVFVDKGEAVVFTVQETPTQLSLMKLKLGEKAATRLHPPATTSEFEPTFAADGSYAFIQSRGNLNLKLVIRDVAGKDAVFDPGGGFASLRRPAFSPDGTRIAFAIPAATGTELVTVGRDGKDRKTLIAGGMNKDPAWSPDGKRIAFVSSRDGEFDLYTAAADGTNIKRVLKGPGLELRPAWGPDGRRIAFVSNRDGNYELYVVRPDGTGLRRLTDNADRDDYPAWHPDGKRLVFVGERAGKSDVYVLDAGSEP